MIAIIQFDAASSRLIDRLLGSGRLPTVRWLLERGPKIQLDSAATPDFPAAAYPTLYCGLELGDHGHYYPFQWVADHQRLHCAATHPAPPPPAVWERLARAGRRSLVIDPYESLPPRCEVGVCISGWQLRERVVLPRWSRPREAWLRLAARFGVPRDVTEVFGTSREEDLTRLRKRLLAAPGRVAAAANHHLGSGCFDLVWLNFASGHLGGHRLWDAAFVDTAANGDPLRRERSVSVLEEVYEAIDTRLAQVLAALPPRADVILVSPIGMDENTSRADLLPAMLEAVLRTGARSEPESRCVGSESSSGESPAGTGTDDAESGWIWRLRGGMSPQLRAKVAGAIPAPAMRRLTARLELRGTHWDRTQAFAHPADNQGYVRLNLIGRDRDGIVEPADAWALTERIAEGLTSFTDLDGGSAIEEVVRVDGTQHGERCAALPDLVVRWAKRPSADLDGVTSPRYGEIRRRGAGSGRTGNHDETGAWAIVAPGKGQSVDGSDERRLVDIAATVAASGGVDHSDLPGRSLLSS